MMWSKDTRSWKSSALDSELVSEKAIFLDYFLFYKLELNPASTGYNKNILFTFYSQIMQNS